MDTKTVHKQPQVLLCGSGLSGGVYKNLMPLLFLSLIFISYFLKFHVYCPLKCASPEIGSFGNHTFVINFDMDSLDKGTVKQEEHANIHESQLQHGNIMYV